MPFQLAHQHFFSCSLLLLAVRALRTLLLQTPTQMNVLVPPLPHASLHLNSLRMFSLPNNTTILNYPLRLMLDMMSRKLN